MTHAYRFHSFFFLGVCALLSFASLFFVLPADAAPEGVVKHTCKVDLKNDSGSSLNLKRLAVFQVTGIDEDGSDNKFRNPVTGKRLCVRVDRSATTVTIDAIETFLRQHAVESVKVNTDNGQQKLFEEFIPTEITDDDAEAERQRFECMSLGPPSNLPHWSKQGLDDDLNDNYAFRLKRDDGACSNKTYGNVKRFRYRLDLDDDDYYFYFLGFHDEMHDGVDPNLPLDGFNPDCGRVSDKDDCNAVTDVCAWNERASKCEKTGDAQAPEPVDPNKAREEFLEKQFDKNDLSEAEFNDYQARSGILPRCAFRGDCDDVNDLVVVGVNIGQFIFKFVGAIAFAFVAIGGLMMMLSFGNASRFQAGQNALIAAIIGLAISVGAYFIIDQLLEILNVSESFRGIN